MAKLAIRLWLQLPLQEEVGYLYIDSRLHFRSSPAVSRATAAELTPPNSASAQGALSTRSAAVPCAMERGAAETAPEGSGTPPAGRFAPREDRLAEPLSADNAQARLPPRACIFVANLSNQREDVQLQEALERNFGYFGRCYAKIRRDKNKMPMAFVSFHEIDHARAAIRESKGMVIDGRPIRAEHAKADRTLLLTRHTGGSISEEEAFEVLAKFGAIEETCGIAVTDRKIVNLPEGRWVKFAYPQDCFDAQFALRTHDRYRLVDRHFAESRPQYRSTDASLVLRKPAHHIHRANPKPTRNAANLLMQTATLTGPCPRIGINACDLPDDHFVYVGNLPVDVTKKQLYDYFHEFGGVVDAQIRRRPHPNSDYLNTFAFVCFENLQTVEAVVGADLVLGGHDIRVERKRNNLGRKMRRQRFAYNQRHQDSIWLSLYHQGLQMGLHQDQAKQILNMGQHPRQSSVYQNQPFYFPASKRYRYLTSNYRPPPFHPQPNNMEYQQYLEGPQIWGYHGQHGHFEPPSSIDTQFNIGGATYFGISASTAQAMNQHQADTPMESMSDRSYHFDYGDRPDTSVNTIPLAYGHQYPYSHESYDASIHCRESTLPDRKTRPSAHSSRHSH